MKEEESQRDEGKKLSRVTGMGGRENSAGDNKRREGWRMLGCSGLEQLLLPLVGRHGGVTFVRVRGGAMPCCAVPCRAVPWEE